MALDLESTKSLNKNKMTETLLVKGNVVEVTSDEEGLKGAWYLAKIVNPFSRTKKGKAFIEYHSLLDVDGKRRLKEYVDVAFVRPLQPEPNKLKSFEVFDVVDGFYKDGWWKGVITEIKDVRVEDKKENKRYTVIFDNPPDQIEFGPSSLRLHLDWVDGSWVKPKKQKDIKYSTNGQELSRHANNNAQSPKVATQLEYSSSGMDGLKEKIPGRNLGKNSMQSNSPGCAPVLSHPSMKLRRESTLHQKPRQELDATIRTLTKCSKHHLILKEHSSENENLFEEPSKEDAGIENFAVEEDIPPKLPFKRKLVLKAGSEKDDIYSAGHTIEVEHKAKKVDSFGVTAEWSRDSPAETCGQRFDEDISNAAYSQDQSGHAINNARSSDLALQLECSNAAKGNIEEKTPCTNSGKTPMLQLKTYNGIYSFMKRRKTSHTEVKGSAPNSVNTEKSATPLYFLEGHAESMPLEKPNKESKLSISTQTSCSTQNEVCNQALTAECERSSKEPNHQENRVEITMEEHEMLAVSNQEETKDQEKTKELDEIMISVEELGIPMDSQVEGQLILTAGEEDNVVGGGDMEIKDGTTKVVELPFVKRFPFWKKIESLEIFQSIPQKPHFHPLSECKKLDREGSAICQMVKFANVVGLTSKLQVDSPHEDFSNYLEALVELKTYGFDVETVVHRLNELLSIKDRQVQLQDRSRKVQVQIVDYTLEKITLEENISASHQTICGLLLKIDELKEKLRQVEEKRSLDLSVKQMKDSQITNLQSESSAIWENILKAGHDFEGLATASW